MNRTLHITSTSEAKKRQHSKKRVRLSTPYTDFIVGGDALMSDLQSMNLQSAAGTPAKADAGKSTVSQSSTATKAFASASGQKSPAAQSNTFGA